MLATKEIPGISRDRRERIECFIAYGYDAADIALKLTCPLEDVAAVWQRMELINQIGDGESVGRRTQRKAAS